MNSENTGPGKKTLTTEQRAAIANVFKRHKIALNERNVNYLFANIETAWDYWHYWTDKSKRMKIGQAEMQCEVKRLLRCMKSLNPSTLLALHEASCRADIHDVPRELEQAGVTKAPADIQRVYLRFSLPFRKSQFKLALQTLIETCTQLLAGAPSLSQDGVSVIAARATKAGRPKKGQDVMVAYSLWSIYRTVAGKEPSETPHGPFDDLLSAVFNIIDPCHERRSFRKLIRKMVAESTAEPEATFTFKAGSNKLRITTCKTKSLNHERVPKTH